MTRRSAITLHHLRRAINRLIIHVSLALTDLPSWSVDPEQLRGQGVSATTTYREVDH